MDNSNSAQRGSDQFLENCCFTCQENGLNIEAHFYCQQCTTFYCDECDKPHGQLFKKHDVVGRDSKAQWPVGQACIELVEKCKEHESRKLELYCEDHSQLCCYQCQFDSHRTCSKIALIAEKAKGFPKTTDFQRIPKNLIDQQEKIDRLSRELNDDLQLLKASHIRCKDDIQSFRTKINEYFDELEKKSTEDLDHCLTDSQKAIQFDIDQCTKLQRELHTIGDALRTITKDNESLSFMIHKKCQTLSQSYKDIKRKDNIITFHKNPSIEKFFSSLSEFGKIVCESSLSKNEEVESNQKISVTGDYTSHNIQVASDSDQSFITGVHEFPDGTIVLSDRNNKRVKLLDKDYKIVTHLVFPGAVWDLCGVTANEIAVISDDVVHEVYLCRVADGQIQKNKNLTLQHKCIGIAFGTKSGHLFITSGTMLYQYTLDGKRVKEIFNKKSNDSVYKCAISPDETKIYVIDHHGSELNTLSKDGIQLSTTVSPKFKLLTSVRVTDNGQLLVCAYNGNSVYQVDCDGKDIISEVIAAGKGIINPGSMFYSTKTKALIIGQYTSFIAVFKTN
ncbi:uncharacterized protein LOC127872766 [Dreissena polymorpha]|uniref:B box-type domain-containing protein n=1 Tax=Dreissena polymorpha TaxID=45954 RepID=A0A9D4KQS5_DREPO|nr:uncharacterized protein LOC127872766 [Dreissena polymorpha]KAH3844342.1 hypothetical protein DPMN_086600 [Dreissena polymorpha]